jgi:hypothetical protein
MRDLIIIISGEHETGRALPYIGNMESKPWMGFEPTTSTSLELDKKSLLKQDLYLTKVTLYQAELPRQSNGQSSQ